MHLPLLTVIGLAVALAGMPARAADGPELVIEEPVFDFGTVEQGTSVEHTFRVRNAGRAELRIDHVKTSCGCLAGLASAADIPPGGEGRVNVVLDTGRIVGRTTKVVTVYTNDPAAPSAGLALSGAVETDIVASPAPLYLGKLRRGEAVEREIRVTPGRPGASYEVTAVEHTNPALRTSLERLPDGAGQRIVVTLEPHMPLGRFNDQLVLRTTSPRQSSLGVSVFGSVEGDVVVLPPQVTFGLARPGMTTERDLYIRNRGTHPLAVTAVSVPQRIVSYRLDTVQEGQEYRLTLRLRDGLPPGKVEGAVEIFTDHPDEGRLVVPLYAIVRDGGRRG